MRFTIFPVLLLIPLVAVITYTYRVEEQVRQFESDVETLGDEFRSLPPNLERSVSVLERAKISVDPYQAFTEKWEAAFKDEMQSRRLPDDFESDRTHINYIVDVENPDNGVNEIHIYVPHGATYELEFRKTSNFDLNELNDVVADVNSLIKRSAPHKFLLSEGVTKLSFSVDQLNDRQPSKFYFAIDRKRISTCELAVPPVLGPTIPGSRLTNGESLYFTRPRYTSPATHLGTQAISDKSLLLVEVLVYGLHDTQRGRVTKQYGVELWLRPQSLKPDDASEQPIDE